MSIDMGQGVSMAKGWYHDDKKVALTPGCCWPLKASLQSLPGYTVVLVAQKTSKAKVMLYHLSGPNQNTSKPTLGSKGTLEHGKHPWVIRGPPRWRAPEPQEIGRAHV